MSSVRKYTVPIVAVFCFTIFVSLFSVAYQEQAVHGERNHTPESDPQVYSGFQLVDPQIIGLICVRADLLHD